MELVQTHTPIRQEESNYLINIFIEALKHLLESNDFKIKDYFIEKDLLRIILKFAPLEKRPTLKLFPPDLVELKYRNFRENILPQLSKQFFFTNSSGEKELEKNLIILKFNIIKQYHSLETLGIVVNSPYLRIEYIKMCYEARGHLEQLHQRDPENIYIELSSDYMVTAGILFSVYKNIHNFASYSRDLLIEKEYSKDLSEFSLEKLLWIPTQDQLKKIIQIIERKDGIESYKLWYKKNRVSYKSEEINSLAYIMQKLHNKRWFRKPKNWCSRKLPLIQKINEYITLKLGHNLKIKLYVNNEEFYQCRSVLLYFPQNEIQEYENIESIDEAIDKNQESIVTSLYRLDPETEFWGHCSNLQAWHENNYDTRILHSNLSFPLLKKLAEIGDPKAREVFKEEIALRLESNYPSVVRFLLNMGYLTYFNLEELDIISHKLDFSILGPNDCESFYKIIRKKKEKEEIKREIMVLTESLSQFDLDLLKEPELKLFRSTLNSINSIIKNKKIPYLDY
jgi:hypothetical protein